MKRAAFALAALLRCLPALGIETGGAMPALTVKRLDLPGQSLALQSLKGKVVYVDFWASWCVPCRLSMPRLDALHQKHGSSGFTVLGVNKDASVADAERFLKRVPVRFPLAIDAQDAVAKAFDVKAMPSGYLIDRRGVVRKIHRGFTAETATALESEVEALLKDPA